MPYIIFDFSGTLVSMRPPKLLANRQLLLKLSKRYPLGIITGGSKTEVTNILKFLQVNNLFARVITADDTVYRKPDPRLIFAPTKYYIGDSPKDARLAQNSRIRFIRITKYNSINQTLKFLLK